MCGTITITHSVGVSVSAEDAVMLADELLEGEPEIDAVFDGDFVLLGVAEGVLLEEGESGRNPPARASEERNKLKWRKPSGIQYTRRS